MAKKELNVYIVTFEIGTYPIFRGIVEISAHDVPEAVVLLKKEFPKCGPVSAVKQGRL